MPEAGMVQPRAHISNSRKVGVYVCPVRSQHRTRGISSHRVVLAACDGPDQRLDGLVATALERWAEPYASASKRCDGRLRFESAGSLGRRQRLLPVLRTFQRETARTPHSQFRRPRTITLPLPRPISTAAD